MNGRLPLVAAALVAALSAALLLFAGGSQITGPSSHPSAPRRPASVAPLPAPAGAPRPKAADRAAPALAPVHGEAPDPAPPSPTPPTPPVDAPGEEPPPEITVEVSAWPLTPEGVKGAILEVVPHVKGCYEDGLDEVPDLGGALTVSFTVVDHDGVGRIDTVDLVHNELRDGPVEDCVLAAMRALQFDAPEDGQMTITYPLVFAPE